MESDKPEPEPENQKKAPEEPTPMATDNADKPETDGPSTSNGSNPDTVSRDLETWTILEDGENSGPRPTPMTTAPVQPPPAQLIYPPTGNYMSSYNTVSHHYLCGFYFGANS